MRAEAVTAGLVAHIFLVPYPPGALHGKPHATAEEHHTLEGKSHFSPHTKKGRPKTNVRMEQRRWL